MKILVAGGTGFIGSALSSKLIKSGYDVVTISKKGVENSHIKFYQQDIVNNKGLETIFAREKPDVVINEAGIVYWNEENKDPVKDIETTVIGTLNLLKNCVKYNVKKFVFASSVSVYGKPSNKRTCVKEDDFVPYNDIPLQIFSYAVAKRTAEQYIYYFQKKFGLGYTILRYAHVYGPGQEQNDVFSCFINNLLNNKPLIVEGDGNQIRDYVYIDDVVDATIAAIDKGDNRTYNIGGGAPVSVNDLVEMFENIWAKIQFKYKESGGKGGGIYMHIAKAKKELGWVPKISIEEGLRRTFEYFEEKQK